MIGSELASRRRGMRLTQKQLAEILDVTVQSVSNWETGRNPVPSQIAMLVEHVVPGVAEERVRTHDEDREFYDEERENMAHGDTSVSG